MAPIRPDEDDLMREAVPADGSAAKPEVYRSPQGAVFAIERRELVGRDCALAAADAREGSDGAPEGSRRGLCGLLVVLDGTRTLRRIGRLVQAGEIDPAALPAMVGIDAEEPLLDYTPWWHPAFKQGAPDFGGGADAFLDKTVLPVLAAARCELGMAGGSDPIEGASGSAEGVGRAAGAPATRTALFGYSLAGLFCLNALMRTDAFDTYLVASPSTWYPGFVSRLERTPLVGEALVAIACGASEGLDHPEPIRGIRQETDRAVATLSARLPMPPTVMIDMRDHHSGFARRLRALLGWLGEVWRE